MFEQREADWFACHCKALGLSLDSAVYSDERKETF